MTWRPREKGGYEVLREGGGEAEGEPAQTSSSNSSGRARSEGDGAFLMLTMKDKYIRKFLHFVLFPSKVARYSASFLHMLMSEAFIVAQLTLELGRQMALVPGKKWVLMLLRLLVYSALLMPGFIQVAFFYFFSSRVKRSVVYGPNPRNRCDLYLPPGVEAPYNLPVTIFVTGGAWIIGYKAWGSLFGKVLSKEGVLVVSLDYRNFPQGRIKEMLEDVDRGIGWVINNIHKYGGDPTNVCLVGQSAGAHLSSLALIECAEKLHLAGGKGSGKASSWTPQQIKAFIGVSGAYDMDRLSDHLNSRGLHLSLLNAIMSVNGATCFEDISPATRIFNYVEEPDKYSSVVDSLPPVTLLHGKDDDSIPYEHAEEFGHVLERAGVEVDRIFYEGETHTTPLIENPMRGTGDRLSEGVLSVIKPETDFKSSKNRRLVPEVLIRLALKVSPF
ncbi:isoprenylcysteine alpha-carbonyl methylesterase ICME [Chloropicon primus]|uniref:protein-S-isoprenylcysteine alpha-carbonyl methylesterase n=1 Tax=Chloropicon primus TaxID=1764295 RepID=A0A5B8MD77_9CHLO|nr:isoprenylcysteine alpha-carbonyl methylesterase ICME [Chloropicon primus]UPQ96783.1 isoprenylcysteine alpha-carbonyl methylesterase ICME [Chloropicon primus]|eukprot:QDZ17565.1 isoprenylcysteine alpha-carbonyl methylesterase ICME [Chloropicon primus]